MPGVFLILMLAQAAGFQQGTEGACADLAQLERIAIHAHEARYSYGERQLRLEMGDIGSLSRGLTTGNVVPQTGSTGLARHRAPLDTYLALHREAVSLYEVGDREGALDTLRRANSRKAWRARQELSDFWGCRQEVGSAQYQNHRNRPRRAGLPPEKQPKVKKRPSSIPAWKVTLLKARAMATEQKDKMIQTVTKPLPESMQNERVGGIILSSAILLFFTLIMSWKLFKAGDRSNRKPCHIPARLIAQSGNYQVTIIDIGPGGAKIHGGPQLKQKTPMRLVVGKTTYKGKAAWGNNQYSGIAFAKKLTPLMLAKLISGDKSVSIAEKNGTDKLLKRLAA